MQPDSIGYLVLAAALIYGAIRFLQSVPTVIPRNEEYREDLRS